MAHKPKTRRRQPPKKVLRLPDLDFAKRALNTLGSPQSVRAYASAIDDFVEWYCSEPRLAFSRLVVLRYRLELEARRLAASTINLRLAAIRRLAYEAADTGLLSPELAAGIQRVKGAKKLGVRLGNWLTAEQSRALLKAPSGETLKGIRDRAVLALLLGCGLRRAEQAKVDVRDFQQREELGHRRPHGKRSAYSHGTRPRLGKSRRGHLARERGNHRRTGVPGSKPVRFSVGHWDHRESRLARREALRKSGRNPEVRAP